MAESITDELFSVADAASGLRAKIDDAKLQSPLKELLKACEEIKRAWCGSNIGYHASVYFQGLNPAPAGAFNPEWGLMDRWPTHQPHPNWQVMDDQAVIREIHNRAGNPDIDGLAAELSEARARFFSLQRAAVSMLTTLVDEQRDTFLTDSLNRIKQLIAPEPGVVERSALPRGQVFSRDSRAMTQGLRAAPHQSAIALPLSAITLRNGIETLE